MRTFVLLVVAFLSGGTLMALEIAGSRLLYPHFGGDIFTWASLIGVFLAALTIGYFWGGKLVDRFPSAWPLSVFLLAAGAFIMLLPRYSWGWCDALAARDLDARVGPLLAAVILFFLPGVLMGTTSPFVIRLTARSLEHVGETAGIVYAVSTLGSILGTLGTAFFLLSYMGMRNIQYLLGGVLMVTALLAALVALLARGGRGRAGTPIPAALVLLSLLAVAAAPGHAKERILLERDSPYHHLFVTEEGDYRWLRADNVWHTEMRLSDPHGRGLPYADYIDLAFLYNPDIRSVLVIGLGGGTIPKRFVRDYPKVTVDAVEIDPDVIKIAARYFDVKPQARLRISESDGRQFLRRSKAKYDLIVLDAYYADTVPFFLCTKEFFQIVQDHLSSNGVFVNNTIGTLSGSKSKFFRSVYRTMKEVFGRTYAFTVPEAGPIMNIEIFALKSGQQVSIETVRTRAEQMQGKVIKDPDLLKRVGNYLSAPVDTNGVPTLTDDYAPVDALLHLW